MAAILCVLFLGISTATVADPPDEIMVEQAYQSAAEPSPKAQGDGSSQKEEENKKSEEKKQEQQFNKQSMPKDRAHLDGGGMGVP